MKSLFLMVLLGAAVAQVEFINDAIGDLSIRLLKKTAGCKRDNTVLSAYSISTALGMCLVGAKGETFSEMQEGLGLNALNVSAIRDGYSDSITELTPFAKVEKSPEGFVLSSANRLYVSKQFRLAPHYLQTVRNIFHAKVAPADFSGNPEGVQGEINSFVSKQTRGLIPELLRDPLDTDTKVALVNALYFKALWLATMGKRQSEHRFNDFPNGSNQTADWIGITTNLGYISSKAMKAEFIEVPYKSRSDSPVKASMLFIQPYKMLSPRFGQWLACDKFTWANISDTIKSMERMFVDLTLPRFKLKSDFKLSPTLSDLGMVIPFTLRADFSEMTGSYVPGFAIDTVIHSATIEVNENGTEAAAATLVGMGMVSTLDPGPKPLRAKLDRSFIAMIILRQGDSIVPLFTAAVNKL